MKTVGILLLLGFLAVVFLRSDLTPWRIVSRQEYDDLKAQLSSAQALAARNQFRPASPAWMFDPNYRTSLDKSTVAGVPEASKRRER